jgi:hypothetical protein
VRGPSPLFPHPDHRHIAGNPIGSVLLPAVSLSRWSRFWRAARYLHIQLGWSRGGLLCVTEHGFNVNRPLETIGSGSVARARDGRDYAAGHREVELLSVAAIRASVFARARSIRSAGTF